MITKNIDFAQFESRYDQKHYWYKADVVFPSIGKEEYGGVLTIRKQVHPGNIESYLCCHFRDTVKDATVQLTQLNPL